MADEEKQKNEENKIEELSLPSKPKKGNEKTKTRARFHTSRLLSRLRQ